MQRSIPGSLQFASKATSYAAVMIAVMGLAACGGGGGGNDNPPPSGPSTQPPPPPPANTAPTVTAGDDQTIKLPTNSVSLTGSATDPENNPLTYAWTSSPADGVTFANAAAAATQATFTTAGTYTLTLTANDGTTTATDTVAITVQAADAPPPPPPVEMAWPGADPNDPVADPNHGWVATTPAEVGMDLAQLQAAEQYALTGGGAGMVVRHGKVVHKWGNIDGKADIKSTTKSMASIALGLAIDRNLVALGDTAVSRYPNFGIGVTMPPDPSPSDPAVLATITLQQLATHTAGFDKPRNSHVNLVAAPGAEWRYSDGGLNWLADTLTNVFQQDLYLLLRDAVFQYLHITTDDLEWRTPGTNDVRPQIGNLQMREFSAGITANPNAMARIGLLFLRKGKWQEREILSESFVDSVSKPLPATIDAVLNDPAGFPAADENYGIMWWTNATRQMDEVPADAYWGWGLGDSLIVVIPSLDLVIARTGANPDDPASPRWRPGWNGNYEWLDDFLEPIARSVVNPAL